MRVKIPVSSVTMPIDSPYVSGEMMRRRLESIRATGRVVQSLPPERRRPVALTQAEAVVNAGPAGTARSGPGLRARRTLRSAVLRGLKPYTSYQQSANSAILAAVEELNSSLDRILEELREQAAVDRAELLGEIRRLNQPRIDTPGSRGDRLPESDSAGPA